ncbi:hypothetical protein PHET_01659 [Paragonimus heterotremus]|uniref:Uncharacterized protein n=1 Tax=Paragonimus heterotremus TaxID=100268 RepID=A0A8J4SRW3_9TREM|nr:hypothetical protein PHET_01659 [Paragonimus heterotremus]
MERETRELRNTKMTSVENLLTESSKLKTIGNQWRQEQDELQHCIEQCERNKDRVSEECVRFFTILRALRNIAEKATNGLCSLSTHPVTNQHKTSLQTNFRLIMRFLFVMMAIRDEICPPSRKGRQVLLDSSKNISSGQNSTNGPTQPIEQTSRTTAHNSIALSEHILPS